MRDILFRGKRENANQWVFGNYAKKDLPFHSGTNHFILNNDCLSFIVIPETVGQFTGLTDKNGTKIFEGDIVKFIDKLERQEFYGTVAFRNCSFVIEGDLFIYYRWIDYDLEVIGNIHDNDLGDFK